MANKVISMQVLCMLIQLLEKGFSIRRMSRELQLSRKTITQYVLRLKNTGLDFAALRGLDDASLSALVYISSEPVVLPEDVRLRKRNPVIEFISAPNFIYGFPTSVIMPHLNRLIALPEED